MKIMHARPMVLYLIFNTRIFTSVVLLVVFSVASSASYAGVEFCSQMLVEDPGSVEVRACFAREMNSLTERMSSVSAKIEAQAVQGRSAFKLEDFTSSQAAWKKYVASTCWLDAAGASNADAVFQHCSSKYALQRLSQLEALYESLTGEPIMWPMSQLEFGR